VVRDSLQKKQYRLLDFAVLADVPMFDVLFSKNPILILLRRKNCSPLFSLSVARYVTQTITPHHFYKPVT
jgi:hypothetical protein